MSVSALSRKLLLKIPRTSAPFSDGPAALPGSIKRTTRQSQGRTPLRLKPSPIAVAPRDRSHRSAQEEAVDGGLEVDDGAEDAAFQAAPGQPGEEALDRVEPGA
jgi:hypothetical protein